MDTARSQELIVGCLAASAAVAAGSGLADDDDTTPGFRLVLGVTVTGIGLAAVSMFNPDLAGAFATLVLTTTVFVYGGPAMEAISRLTGPTGGKLGQAGQAGDGTNRPQNPNNR